MQQRPTDTGAQALESLSVYVRQELQGGASSESIITRLKAKGLKRETAQQLVQRVAAGMATSAPPPSATTPRVTTASVTTGSLVPAVIGGLVAAVIAGAIWGLITVVTGYEIGWVAWGVGILAGYGAVVFARGQRGVPLQLVAVGAAMLGVAIGKYVTFYAVLKQYAADEFGAEATAQISMFSLGTFQFFAESVPQFISGFDALWMVLAVATAWGIPKARTVEPAELAVAPEVAADSTLPS